MTFQLSPSVPWLLIRIILVTALSSITGCAHNSGSTNCPDNNLVDQAFSFGDSGENQDIEILKVYYGIPGCPPNYDSEKLLFNGKPLQVTNIVGGPARRAWILTVEWRVKNTNTEYKESVDLKSRLPKDMTNHKIHFWIKGSQLFVFLITPEKRPKNTPPNGPRMTQHLKTITVFPDQHY
ncbi:hypothetical protein [Methylophilus sp. UBA6697]|jgi:hypothetical protein|uniref:hypothetical protein n=1 Tax=Methylophilus sp. UBA6697 TaxID=1946902 RepID=UPI0025E1CB8C|nr:hypothetical protein [Methylophilus sp. UBA6697]